METTLTNQLTTQSPSTTIHLLLLIPTPFEAGALPKGPVFSSPAASVHLRICGIGPRALEKAFHDATHSHSFDALLLAGFAGALDPKLAVASCHEASPNSESTAAFYRRLSLWPTAQKGDRPPFAGPVSGSDKGDRPPFGAVLPVAKLVSTEAVVATAAAKSRLFGKTGAQLVDMEGEVFAGLASGLGVPWRILRSVSDGADQTLPVGALEAGFDAITLRNTPFQLFLHLARWPAEIAPFVRFVRALGPARRELTKAIMAACS